LPSSSPRGSRFPHPRRSNKVKPSSASLQQGQRFRGGLVFKAHRLLYHSALGLRVIKKKKKVNPEPRNILVRGASLLGSGCFTEMCSGFEAVYHSTPGLRVIKKKKKGSGCPPPWRSNKVGEQLNPNPENGKRNSETRKPKPELRWLEEVVDCLSPPLTSGRGTTSAEDAQGTSTQSHISPSILVSEHCHAAPPRSPAIQRDQSEDRNPKPETRNPNPESRNPEPETRNPKPVNRRFYSFLDPKPATRKTEPEPRRPMPEMRWLEEVAIHSENS